MAYKIFTVSSGSVSKGATVETFTLKGVGVSIPAILVGETGRGRKLGVLAVQLPNFLYRKWKTKGSVTIYAAELGQTRSGKPKLFAKNDADTDEKIICVFRTKIGFRGGNAHTGDQAQVIYELNWGGRDKINKRSTTDGEKIDERMAKLLKRFDTKITYTKFDSETRKIIMEAYGLSEEDFVSSLTFKEFPGEILVSGIIAQGAAGRMGSGTQLVAVIPKNIVFRTGYSGRLYGASPAHYYIWNGEQLLAATWEERTVADIF